MDDKTDNPVCFDGERDSQPLAGAGLREIFSCATDAVFAIDDAHRIVYQNETFARIFRQRLSRFPGRKCHEVVCGQTLDGQPQCRPDCPVGENLLDGRALAHFDLTVPQPEGEPLWFCVGAFPLSSSFGDAAAVCMLRPVSAYKVLARLSQMNLPNEVPPPPAANPLTPREREILRLLAEGHNTRKLADKLHISYVTTRNHIHHIFEKLGVHSRAEAVSSAFRHRLI